MELLIAERVRENRKRLGLTQEELAGRLGVSPQTVSYWENGGYPDITMLPALANYFGVGENDPIATLNLFHNAVLKASEKYNSIRNYLISRKRVYSLIVDTLHLNPNGDGDPVTGFVDLGNLDATQYNAVVWAFTANPQIVSGTNATHFSPDAILTRAMAEEARPKPFWERLFPVFRTAAAFCALALVFTFVFPYLPKLQTGFSVIRAEVFVLVFPAFLEGAVIVVKVVLRDIAVLVKNLFRRQNLRLVV